jgi:hypothetical protein
MFCTSNGVGEKDVVVVFLGVEERTVSPEAV